MAVSLQWVLNFSNSIVGVGLLTMPYCYQQCGIILATLMILGSGHLTKVTCEFLLRTGSYTRKSNYEQIAQMVYGNAGKLLCEISTIGVSLGTLVAFQVVIGDLAPAVVTGTFGFENTWLLRAVMMITMCGLVLPLCLMRSISSLAGLNTISMTFYATFIFIVCCTSLPSLSALDWWNDVYFWRPTDFFKCLPIILLAYNCQAQVFIFYAALPDPNMKSMLMIIHKAINLVNFFYVTTGLFGYIAFYKVGVHGDVMENFPSGFLTVIMKLGFLLSVIISFPLMCFPVRSSINSLMFSDKKQGILHDVITNSSGYISPDKFVMITLGLVSSTLVVGILVPKIEIVLSITGALAGSFICLVFPSALFVMAGAKDKLRSLGLGILLLSSLVMIVCTSTSLYGIMAGEPPPLPQQNNMATRIEAKPDIPTLTELPVAKIETMAPLIHPKEIKRLPVKITESEPVLHLEEKRSPPAAAVITAPETDPPLKIIKTATISAIATKPPATNAKEPEQIVVKEKESPVLPIEVIKATVSEQIIKELSKEHVVVEETKALPTHPPLAPTIPKNTQKPATEKVVVFEEKKATVAATAPQSPATTQISLILADVRTSLQVAVKSDGIESKVDLKKKFLKNDNTSIDKPLPVSVPSIRFKLSETKNKETPLTLPVSVPGISFKLSKTKNKETPLTLPTSVGLVTDRRTKISREILSNGDT